MTMVAQFHPETNSWTNGNGQAVDVRQTWRHAVAEVAENAKQALPDSHGRIDAAVKIVLAGDVELQADGPVKVASQSNGATAYYLVNGECSCMDFPKAPSGFCKHRLAYALYKRASALGRQRLEAQLDGPQQAQPVARAQAEAPAAALPEAPASANCYIDIAGRKVQVTLRDSDESRLLARLEALLHRFPVEEDTGESTPAEGWCSKHSVQMTRHSNDRGSWWSHKTAEGWCRGK